MTGNDHKPRGANNAAPADAGSGLGTFSGVFTPSVLTILGIILFLRLGFVVGAAGLTRAMVIILMANAISILTSISLSAIATNLRVKGGGDYYLISRTLGVDYGGALGIVLFLAQSVSIAFYAIGFGEALGVLLGFEHPWAAQAVAAAAVAALFVLSWLGADWATRFQYVVMAVLIAALVAFYVGGLSDWSVARLRGNLSPSVVLGEGGEVGVVPFWFVFALFFPAVTGFTQGVSMSGDLRNPAKSLPRGTFLAVFLSMFVYVTVALVFAGGLAGTDLVEDNGARAMRRVAGLAWLVDAGVIAATLSSALASFLGAPRILQSLARDRVFPFLNPFAAGHGPANNPRRGVLLSAGIAFGTIAMGKLNVIAPVVSMFFLISYGLLNYATYFEAKANSPSFRPRFRFFHARVSLAGCLACLGAMLAIHPTAGAIAVAVLFALHQYVSRSVDVERWADSSRSRRMQRVREDLHKISADLEHPRDWRPVVVAFTENPERRERMLRFASWLEGRSGFTTAAHIVPGEGPGARRIHDETETALRKEIALGKLPAFAKVIVTDDPFGAVPVLLQAHGLGRLRANTVMLNWYDRFDDGDVPGLRSYGHYPRQALRFGCNLVILAAASEDFDVVYATAPRDRRIDVWYRDNATGRLMLLLAYLMTRTVEWEEARIRLLAQAPADGSRDEFLRELKKMLEEVRIVAEPVLVESTDLPTMTESCASAGMVFLPIRLDEDGPGCVFEAPLDALVEQLGVTAMVLASEDIELTSEPEEGKHGEIAQAVDLAKKARKTARQAAKEAAAAEETAHEIREKLEAARDPKNETGVTEELEAAAEEAGKEAERTKRRALRAQAKAEAAIEEAETLLGRPLDGSGS